MASLRDIRKRIKTVKSTAKITKAMKMVAASKLRKAQEEVRKNRAYTHKLNEMIAHLAKRLQEQSQYPDPLLKVRDNPKKAGIIVLTSDRGLCAGFNSNVVRATLKFIQANQTQYSEFVIYTIGKKGLDAMNREKVSIYKNYEQTNLRDTQAAASIAQELCESYIKEEIDVVYLAYNEFKSAITQKIVIDQLLPVVPIYESTETGLVEYIYEPSQKELLATLVPKHFATKLHQSFLESLASEHGARMTAMENATKNANEMISNLGILHNRLRQAVITKELIEIVSGAEALN